MGKEAQGDKMTIEIMNRCPICGKEIPLNQKYCCEAHRKLFTRSWDELLKDEEIRRELEIDNKYERELKSF